MRSIIEQGEILTDFEKNELSKYKNDLKRKLSFTIPFTLVLALYFYFFPLKYKYIIYIIAIINITIHILFIYLHQFIYRLKYYILSRYFLSVFYLIQFALITNIFLYLSPIWADYIIFISFFIFFITIYFGKTTSELLKLNRFIKQFSFQIINENYVVDVFKNNIHKEKSSKLIIIIRAIGILIPFIFLGIERLFNFFKLEISHIIILPLILTIILIIFTVKDFKNFCFLMNLEKENNKIIYTRLFEFVLLEDEINQWRRSWKSLRPIKINSIFFNGNVSK